MILVKVGKLSLWMEVPLYFRLWWFLRLYTRYIYFIFQKWDLLIVLLTSTKIKSNETLISFSFFISNSYISFFFFLSATVSVDIAFFYIYAFWLYKIPCPFRSQSLLLFSNIVPTYYVCFPIPIHTHIHYIFIRTPRALPH